jgi:hypothetical protein
MPLFASDKHPASDELSRNNAKQQHQHQPEGAHNSNSNSNSNSNINNNNHYSVPLESLYLPVVVVLGPEPSYVDVDKL